MALGSNMADDNAAVLSANGARGHDEVIGAQAQKLAAQDTCNLRPAQQAQNQHNIAQPRSQQAHQYQNQHEIGER